MIQSPRVSSYRERSSHGHSNDRGMGRPLSFESIVPSPPPSASSAGTMDRDLLDGGTHVPACVGVERGAQFSGDGSLVAAAGGRASNAFRLGLPRGSQGWMAAKTGIDPCQRSSVETQGKLVGGRRRRRWARDHDANGGAGLRRRARPGAPVPRSL